MKISIFKLFANMLSIQLRLVINITSIKYKDIYVWLIGYVWLNCIEFHNIFVQRANIKKASVSYLQEHIINSIRIASKRNSLCFSWKNLQHMYNYSKGITISFIISSKYFKIWNINDVIFCDYMHIVWILPFKFHTNNPNIVSYQAVYHVYVL